MTLIDDAPRTSAPKATPSPASAEVGFATLGLPDTIVRTLAKRKMTTAFPIQAAVIPDALDGRDVAGRAPTGSGKTLGFGLPLVAGLRDARPGRPVALVLAPTRELAEQIMGELTPFAKAVGHWATAVYGGVGYGVQRKSIERGTELIVACPGRLEDLIQMGVVDLGDVTSVVVDEADQMADMGFLPAVRRILDLTHPDRQVQLFSATLDGPVAKLIKDYQRDPAHHEVGPKGPDIEAADHKFWLLERNERADTTAEIIEHTGSTIVFTRTRHGADRLAKRLGKLGIEAAPIHGGRSQGQRDRALAAFKDGTAQALVATDVAARGIHVSGVSCVVHFDLPADAATYHHRSGRTARAGATGIVIALVDPSQKKEARDLQRDVGIKRPLADPDPHALVVDEPATEETAQPSLGDDLHAGTVKFFNAGRGYGFICPQDGGDDLFVHFSNIAQDGFKTLDEDARVSYRLGTGRRGPEAFDVQHLD